MPIYTRKEFCALFNISTQYVSTNVKRGNLVLRGKFINSEDSENKEWIENWKFKNGVEEISEPLPVPTTKAAAKAKPARRKRSEETIPEPQRNKKPELDIPEAPGAPVDVGSMTRTELDIALKKINIKKAQEDFELAVIKKEKQLGQVIPTDLVFGVFARHFKSVTDSFYQASDNMLIELIPGRKELAGARAKLVDIINAAVDDARKNSKKEIKALLDEYSESRGKGESKN